MVDTGKLTQASDWIPEQNAVRLAVISKLQEETAELQTALARCVAQGIDGWNAKEGRTNRVWVEEEMADVRAMLHLMTEKFDLRIDHTRMMEKLNHKREWVKQLGG